MPRASLEHLVESLLGEDRGGRYLDMRLDLVREETGEQLFMAGGRWDRAAKRYVGPTGRGRALGLHEGQMPAGRWFARWLAARRAGEHVAANGKPVFSVILVGGRRGGKSVLAFRVVLTYLVDNPEAIAWIVVPADRDKAEVIHEISHQLPKAWYGYRENEWTLKNGGKLFIRSSDDPEALKVGRCDVAVINEAQKHHPDVWNILRPAIVDRGGLVILTANPPNTARGEWVADRVEAALAGKVGSVVFDLDPMLNPHVDHAALEALKDEMDERTYRREVRGEFLARTDVVMFAFSSSERLGNVRAEGTDEDGRPLENVTREFTARLLGQPFEQVHGLDFQLGPYMAAATARFYRDPEEPTGDPLCWFVDDLEVPQATEDQLISALEGRGYTGADACVPDASGDYQGAERVKGRASWDMFRRRGWRNLYHPDQRSKANPHKTDRLSNANGLFRTASGKRRCFVDPRCAYLIRALRLWEMRNGIPHWRSDYAHIVDAATYLLYRMYPRRATVASREIIIIPRAKRSASWEEELD